MTFYEALLHLYPASFRREYRHELVAAFAQATQGRSALARAGAALADVVPNAIAAHTEILARDLRFAGRSLRRTPGFAVTTILLIALGVGANTAAFTLADFVFVRPLPFTEPQRLVRLFQGDDQEGYFNQLSPANYRDWKAAATSFSGMAAWSGQPANLVGTAEPRRLGTVRATPGFLQLIGVPALLGRHPDTTDMAAGETIVLSHALWQSQFGGDPEVLGRVVRLDGTPHTIVGVMPSGFNFPSRDVEAWTLLKLDESSFANRGDTYLDVIGRLRNGVSLERARGELATISARLARDHPADNEHVVARALLLREFVSSNARALVLALCGAALCILLLACANLANLFLARAMHRARELAVRTALGAGTDVLVRQLITESIALVFLGGAIGVAAAWEILPLLGRLVPDTLPLGSTPTIDVRVLLFAAALVVLTAVLFGVVPALGAGRARILEALRDTTRSGARTRRLRSAFVLVEVAASVVLLVLSGLLIRSVERIQRTDPGFNPAGVLTLRTSLPRPKYDSVGKRAEFYRRVLDEVRALPGVQSAAYVTGLPLAMGWGIWGAGLGDSTSVRDPATLASARFTTPGYFKAMGIPLLTGRDFDDGDLQSSSAYVAVVSESFIRKVWPNEDPIGKRFWFGGSERTVVGVVGHVRVRGLEQQESEPQVYLAHRQVADGAIVGYFPKDLVVRAASAPTALLPAIRRIVRAADPEQPISNVRTMQQIVDDATASRMAQLRLLGVLAAIGLLIAGVGIHGLLTFSVSHRSQELGVRRALGAQAAGIVGLVLGEGLRLAAVGVAAGVVVAYLAARGMAALLLGVRPEDPATLAAAAGLCISVTIIGCVRPAMRAARVDPMTALRAD